MNYWTHYLIGRECNWKATKGIVKESLDLILDPKKSIVSNQTRWTAKNYHVGN